MPELTRDEFLQNPSEWAEQLLWRIPPGWFRRAWVNPKFKESFLGSDHDWDHMHLTNEYFLPYRAMKFLEFLSPEDVPELYELVRNRLNLSEYIWRSSFINVFPQAVSLLPAIESPLIEADFLKEPIKVWQFAPTLVHPDWFVKAWRRADFHIHILNEPSNEETSQLLQVAVHPPKDPSYHENNLSALSDRSLTTTVEAGSYFRNHVLGDSEFVSTLSLTGRLQVGEHLLACLNSLSIEELASVYQNLQEGSRRFDEEWRSDFEALFPQTISSLPPINEPPSKEEFFRFLEQERTEMEWFYISDWLEIPIPWFVEAWAYEGVRECIYGPLHGGCIRWVNKTGELILPFPLVVCFNLLPATEVVDLYEMIRDYSRRPESEWRPAFEKYFPAAVEFLPEIQEEVPPDDIPEESIYQLDLEDPEVLDLPEHRPWEESQFPSEDDIPF